MHEKCITLHPYNIANSQMHLHVQCRVLISIVIYTKCNTAVIVQCESVLCPVHAHTMFHVQLWCRTALPTELAPATLSSVGGDDG